MSTCCEAIKLSFCHLEFLNFSLRSDLRHFAKNRRKLRCLANDVFNMASARHLEFKIICSNKCVRICFCIQNFINVRWLFTEIWQYSDFQDGDGPPSWIFEIWFLFTWPSLQSDFVPSHQVSRKSDYPLRQKRYFPIWRPSAVFDFGQIIVITWFDMSNPISSNPIIFTEIRIPL